MSAAWGKNYLLGTRQLARRSLIATASIGMLGNLVYIYQGNTIFSLWTHNQMQLGNNLLLLGTIYSFLISFSFAQKAMFHAINKNLLVSLISIGFAILLNVIIYNMNSPININAVYLILVSAEFISIPLIYIISRKLFVNKS
jgi:O-antigen/teichoic acid export membrane protein